MWEILLTDKEKARRETTLVNSVQHGAFRSDLSELYKI